MLQLLAYQQAPLSASDLSRFELGKREPPLPLLLQYARVAAVGLEVLVDDGLSLPDPLPRRETAREGCPYCRATSGQVKNGRNKTGSQSYLCQFCRRRYTPLPSSRGYSQEVRRRALQLHQSGMNPLRIGKALGVNRQSVVNWINAYYARGNSAGVSIKM